MQKVTKLIDIEAPCQEVFDTVVNTERRMQLSPLWGLNKLLESSPNFPEPGSSYRVRILTDVPFGISRGTLNASHSALSGLAQVLSLKLGQAEAEYAPKKENRSPKLSKAKRNPPKQAALPTEQEYFVAECQPPLLFSYYLDADCKTIVTWRFQSIPLGTRVNYEEEFCDESLNGDEFVSTVRDVVSEWLNNIKRYSELRDGRGRKIVKWFLDHYYLQLRPDQRRIVMVMVFMHAIALATFMVAAIGWGIVSLLF